MEVVSESSTTATITTMKMFAYFRIRSGPLRMIGDGKGDFLWTQILYFFYRPHAWLNMSTCPHYKRQSPIQFQFNSAIIDAMNHFMHKIWWPQHGSWYFFFFFFFVLAVERKLSAHVYKHPQAEQIFVRLFVLIYKSYIMYGDFVAHKLSKRIYGGRLNETAQKRIGRERGKREEGNSPGIINKWWLCVFHRQQRLEVFFLEIWLNKLWFASFIELHFGSFLWITLEFIECCLVTPVVMYF